MSYLKNIIIIFVRFFTKNRKKTMNSLKFFLGSPRKLLHIMNKWKYMIVLAIIAFNYSRWSSNVQRRYMRKPAEYYISSKGCVVPTLNESSAHKIDCLKKIIRCDKKEVLKRNRTHIWLNAYDRDIQCCYEPIANEIVVSKVLSGIIEFNECQKVFRSSFEVPSSDQYARVICFKGSDIIYQNIFLFAPKMQFTTFDAQSDASQAYNVLILGLDGVSRLNFRRTMPETHSAIIKLGAVEFLGYSTIGRRHRASSNLVSMLVTIKEESPLLFLKTQSEFIWSLYKKLGFFTAVGESSISKFYNPIKIKEYGALDSRFHLYLEEQKRSSYHKELCLQEKPFHEVVLDYTKDLTTNLRHKKFFGFFWESTLCKYCLHYPEVMDKSYAIFFKYLVESGYINNTVIFFVSNHGTKHLDFLKLSQGKREMRLPFLYVIVPPSFRNNFKNAFRNLEYNSKVLTTPYDVLKTMVALTNLQILSDEHIPVEANLLDLQKAGISLFNLIPEERRCADAAVVEFWCNCYDYTFIDVSGTQARIVSLFLQNYLNNLIRNEKRCSPLDIDLIFNVTKGKMYIEDVEYIIEVRTRPGDAIFRAVIINLNVEQVGWSLRSVYRKNAYEIPHCASVEELAPFCHCK